MSDTARCRYCDLTVAPAELVQTTAYWKVTGRGKQPKYPCHAACKRPGEKDEARACQEIDMDCNDCKHFLRGKSDGGDCWYGHCLKKDVPVVARPNFCAMYPCFEHRLS